MEMEEAIYLSLSSLRRWMKDLNGLPGGIHLHRGSQRVINSIIRVNLEIRGVNPSLREWIYFSQRVVELEALFITLGGG